MFTVKQIIIILNKYNKLYVKIEKFTNKNERKDNTYIAAVVLIAEIQFLKVKDME